MALGEWGSGAQPASNEKAIATSPHRVTCMSDIPAKVEGASMSDISMSGASPHPLSTNAAVAALRHRQELTEIVRPPLAPGASKAGGDEQMERRVCRPIAAEAF